ncbi:MAG TPA: T9SS type A sorting domain-containing protein, partial [Chitinophagales bacterium]|nr:T9SS type A sorting domain-containing protein [Chitinophagales bacterium]
LVGNYNGGLWYYSEKIPTVTAVKPAKTQTLSFNIFPNPAGNNMTLEFDNKVLPAQGAVYSIDGKNVLSFEVKSINTQLNIADLPKGIYLISVYNQQYTGTSKFVKE